MNKNKSIMLTRLKIGASAAASWAWGTSLIMGQQIAQEKGAIAFWIWAIANSLTLAIFGWLHNKNVIKPEIYRSKAIKVIAITTQMFCLLVQLNFINQTLGNYIPSRAIAYIITFVVGAIFVLAMYKKGLPTSIFTDVFQWFIALGAIVAILVIGNVQNAEHYSIIAQSGSNAIWGVWSAVVLISGPIGDIQHWQRAEADKTKCGYYLGAAFFFVYMCLIYAMAHFKFNATMDTILIIAVLCVTTSTIDSIAVAMHEMKSKRLGTIISLAICAGWGILAEIGMINLWSSFGVIRYMLAASIIILPLLAKKRRVANTAILLAIAASVVAFIALGSIGVDNVFGIICVGVAAIMYAYLVVCMIARKSDLWEKGDRVG